MMRAPTRKAAARGLAFSASPVLAVKLPAWRSRLALFLLFSAFVVVAVRAFWLQAMSTDFLQRQGAYRYARTLELPAVRGKITDRYGEVMASSLPVKAIWAIPEDVEADKDKLRQLAQLLDTPLSDINKKLESDRSFVYLKRQVEEKTAEQILALNIKGIHTRNEYKRYYPSGHVAAHVLGFTNVEDIGQEGIERAQQKSLGGITGSRRVIKDKLGRVVEDIGYIREPQDGTDLALSIDGKIQYIAFTELQKAVDQHHAKAGAIVVLDVKTGEVLAMANLPTYNPNTRQGLTGAQLRNRVMTDTYEPGSTLKPFTVPLPLEPGLVTPTTMLDTPAKISIGPASIGDSHGHAATMSVAQIIQQSSNVGTVRMAMKCESREMWDMFTSVGFGQVPRTGFPGEVAGRLRPYKTWRPIEQATMSYGYGLSVSLFQLAHAYTVFARDGDLAPASLLKVSEPVAGVRVFSEKNALAMRQMLHSVTQPGGTAQKAQTIGYSVGGKTGTTHKQEGKGYATNKYRGFFVGLAPVEKPRIVVAVMIDEPGNGRYYGGDVAAPVFAQTVQQTLRMMGLPPDVAVKPQIIAKATGESF